MTHLAVAYCSRLFRFSHAPSWKELSGTELQQAATAFQERDASKSGSSVQGEEAVAESSGASPPSRDAWERFGARYFKGTLKTNKSSDGGQERAVQIQVEVNMKPGRRHGASWGSFGLNELSRSAAHLCSIRSRFERSRLEV